MLKLKDRITILKNRTTSQEAVELANAALEACKSNGFMDSVVAENLVKDLEGIDDAEVKNFVAREQRFIEISNLGVKEAYQNVIGGDLMHYPTIKPMLESMKQQVNTLPEYVTAPHFISVLQQYSWNPELKTDLDKISETVEKYKEDIALANFMYEFKNSNGSYLSKMFEAELDNYFVDRTDTNRKKVLEKINPYLFDANIKQLHDILIVSEGGFQIDANGEVIIEKIYSPVLINENEDIFFASNRFLRKRGNTITALSEEEIKALPKNFVDVSLFLSYPNVSVYESKIAIITESGNKKVEIITEGEKPVLKLNGKEMSYQMFTKYFMNEGVFRKSDNNVLYQISVLFENVDNIYEIDYGKKLISKSNRGQWVDIYKTDGKIFVTKVDESQKKNEFISNINAHQTKQLVLEHLRFDITESLRDLMPQEKEKLENLTKQKGELLEAIKLLTDKKITVLEQIKTNPVLRANKEVKDLLEAIDVEVEKLKEQEHVVRNMIKSLTTVGMFTKDELVDEGFIDDIWKKTNKNTVLYFAQEDENGKYLVGRQTYDDYKNSQYWDKVDQDLSVDAAIKMAKDLANKEKNGLYVETDDVKLYMESESKDPDGVDKLNKQNKDMEVSDEIKKNEDLENPLESGDVVKLKNGAIGVVQGNDGNNNTIVIMEDGKSVSIPQEYLHEVEIIKKKSQEAQPEIKTTDGTQSVEVREGNEEWIEGVMLDKKGKEGDEILVNALDYTSKGDDEEINIKTGKGFNRTAKTLKKFIKIVD
jgi:ribosome-associated translation inhibitor RaiA